MRNKDIQNLTAIYESNNHNYFLIKRIQEEIDQNPHNANIIIDKFPSLVNEFSLGSIGKSISGGLKGLAGTGKNLLKGDLKGAGSSLMKSAGNVAGIASQMSIPGSPMQQINQTAADALKTGNVKDAANVVKTAGANAIQQYGPAVATALTGNPLAGAAVSSITQQNGQNNNNQQGGADKTQMLQQLLQMLQAQQA